MSLNIAILASGSGTNAQAIFDKIQSGQLHAKVSLVISNRPGAKVLERAQKLGIPTLELDHKAYADRESFDKVLVQALQQCGAELIVLAGYMRLLTPYFFTIFGGKVINMHPALLPSFKGAHGAADACAWGVKISGCTVHFVDEEMDHGAVIAQGALPVLSGESPELLQKRIQSLEHRLFPQVIQWIAEQRIHVDGRNITLLPRQEVASDALVASSVPAVMNGENAHLIWPPLEEGF